MAPKHRSTISQIEDEEDVEDRRRARKLRKKPTVKLSFADDEMDEPVMLFKKVKHVENKMNSVDQSTPESGQTETAVSSKRTGFKDDSAAIDGDEDAPVVIESSQLLSESSAESIPDVVRICRVLIVLFEELQLHHLFTDIEQNCKFRLFLHAIAYGHTHYWKKDPVLVSVLRRILVTEPVNSALKSERIIPKTLKHNGSETGENTGTEIDNLKNLPMPDQPVVRYCEKIVVPKRIANLLP